MIVEFDRDIMVINYSFYFYNTLYQKMTKSPSKMAFLFYNIVDNKNRLSFFSKIKIKIKVDLAKLV